MLIVSLYRYYKTIFQHLFMFSKLRHLIWTFLLPKKHPTKHLLLTRWSIFCRKLEEGTRFGHLHITINPQPCNRDLICYSPSCAPDAFNIEYHTYQTLTMKNKPDCLWQPMSTPMLLMTGDVNQIKRTLRISLNYDFLLCSYLRLHQWEDDQVEG